MAVSDYSTDPSQNETVSGINIAERCPAGNLNNALRQVLADIRVMYNAQPSTTGYVSASGGMFTTNPSYQGRGGFLYHSDSANASGQVFVQSSGGNAPSGMLNGDLLFEY